MNLRTRTQTFMELPIEKIPQGCQLKLFVIMQLSHDKGMIVLDKQSTSLTLSYGFGE